MDKILRSPYWKIIGILLLLYAIIAGFLVPLKPGIQQVDPVTSKTGDTLTLSVSAYNTHFLESKNELRAWLKLDDDLAISAKDISVTGPTTLQAMFIVPTSLPGKNEVRYASLILDNPVDGPAILPDAVSIRGTSDQPSMIEDWRAELPQSLHIKNDFSFPYRNILAESIRNTYFHVAIWLAMVLIFLMALVYSIRYLRNGEMHNDTAALSLTRIGTIYGILGIVTGMVWAKNTWGAYWPQDVKLNMTAIALLIYLAYFVLRSSLDDPQKRARVAAVYNIFSFAALIPLIYIIPRLNDSLHPGMGGNPALGGEDLDNTMRMVFYPAIIGWTLIGLWVASLSYRTEQLKTRMEEAFWEQL